MEESSKRIVQGTGRFFECESQAGQVWHVKGCIKRQTVENKYLFETCTVSNRILDGFFGPSWVRGPNPEDQKNYHKAEK